jgi:hypothetical protein
MEGCGLDEFGSGQGQETVSCGNDDEDPGSVNVG